MSGLSNILGEVYGECTVLFIMIFEKTMQHYDRDLNENTE